MATDDELLELAQRIVDTVAQQTVDKVPADKQAHLRQYWQVRGGLMRQLARRVVQGLRNQLREQDALDWALLDLQKTTLTRASSEALKHQFESWFVFRRPFLIRIASDFWKLAVELEKTVGKAVAIGLTAKLIVDYLTNPLTTEFDPKLRTEANIQAINLLASGVPITLPKQRMVLSGYTGWGGLSIDRAAQRIPPEWMPASEALIHEYYTPSLLCFELARVLRPFVERLGGSELRALEPSAGIGRFVNALSLEGYERVRWTAVEYSKVSAEILRHLRPDIRVVQGSFESFVAQEEAKLAGKLHLVVTNPPYGERGKTIVDDKHPAYRLKDAYPYFVFRSADLLAPLCFAAFVIPYGFLTGRSAELQGYRKRLLSRHHLLAAFRLPSSLFPGASIVTDLLLLQRRESDLAEPPEEDADIIEGKYFERFPSHLLGEEIRSEKARFGYDVVGTFTRLPDFTERPLCTDCVAVAPTPRVTSKAAAKTELPVYLLPEEVQSAIALGERVTKYLVLLASASAKQQELASRQHAELLEALEAFRRIWGHPKLAKKLIEHRFRPQVTSLFAAFDEEGEIVPQLRSKPVWQPTLGAEEQTLGGVASFLYRTERAVTTERIIKFWQSLKRSATESTVRSALLSAGWCIDGREWLPEADYYTGYLWPRYDRALALRDDEVLGGVAAAQARRLLAAIEPVTLSAIEPDPRLQYTPVSALRSWLTGFCGVQVPELMYRDRILRPKDIALVDVRNLPTDLTVAIGFLNFDYSLFVFKSPPKEIDLSTGKEESDSSAQMRARLKYEAEALQHFRRFLAENPADGELVAEAYNRAFRGWIEPTYTSFVMPARWGNRITLRDHQKAGAARLLSHLGGLLAFDVGVGKTFTGLATLAKLREEGKAKRPVVVVPNSIVWQWYKAAQAALPDSRVLVIGAERYIGRDSTMVSRTDKAEERAQKWRVFQAGGADVVICTYSTFAKAATRPESREAFAWSSPPLLSLLGFEAWDAELDATEKDEKDDKKKKKKKPPTEAAKQRIVEQFGSAIGLTEEEITKAAEAAALNVEREREAERQRIRTLIASLSEYSERERAILQHRIARWASLTAERENADPGIYWEDLGIDALFVDEAQNFKNLWPVQLMPGQTMPKYLGGIDRASQRAMELAVRAFLVRQKNGGSGVYLLSATPAKNSPLEYFSLLSYVDGDSWARLGISDTARFIARYLKIERRWVLDTDLSEMTRDVVTGFLNVPELREIIYRFAEFRTAEEVGLKLPKTDPQTLKVTMDLEQQRDHSRLLTTYRELIEDRSTGARNKALGILMQLSLVAVHPELVTSRPEEGWSGKNWRRVGSIHSAKLDACAAEVFRRPRCGHIIFCEPVGAQYFLREVLAERGIPKERIAILNAEEAPTSLSRQVIAERFNGTAPILDDQGNLEQEGEAPAYDVVIANSVAYEGIDLHIRTCVVHHLDLPWEPATLQQRNGRAVRQGNTQAVIGILYYIAQGSIDAARLTIILGKLTWMKDILASSDRETNNPAAGSELSHDELVMFLYSPDELTTLRAKMVAKKEREDRRAARRRAWQICKRIYDTVSPEQTETNHEVRELVRQLNEIPAQTWPWQGLVIPPLLRGVRFTWFDLRYRRLEEDQPASAEDAGEELIVTVPLWEGAVFASESVQIEVAKVSVDGAIVRFAGSVEWIEATPIGLNNSRNEKQIALYKALRNASPDQFDRAKWPQTLDKLTVEQKLGEAVASLPADSLAPLGMRLAPDSWRQMVWEYWGKRVLDRIRRVAVPVDRGPLTVVAGALGPTTPQPLPWTDEGFARFVERGQSTNLKWSDLNQISLTWFERPFPTGGRKDTEQELEVIIGGTSERRTALWLGNGIAVFPKSGERKYDVWLLNLGGSVATFSTRGKAERYADWLQTLPLHWTATDIAALTVGFPKPGRLDRVKVWLEAQVRVPTFAEVVVYFEGL